MKIGLLNILRYSKTNYPEVDEILNQVAIRKALLVFPHPDDESVMSAGLLQRMIANGFEITLVCLTHGERGRIYCHGRGRNMMEIRAAELAKAVKCLGKIKLRILDYPDGKLRQLSEWEDDLKRIIQEFNPEIIVSYDPSGFSGHPDHVASSKAIWKILKNGQMKIKLLWVSLDPKLSQMMLNSQVNQLMRFPSHQLNLSTIETWNKSRAIMSHWCQGLWLKLSLWIWFWIIRKEYYVLVDLKKPQDFIYPDYQL